MGNNPKFRALKGMPDMLPEKAKKYWMIEKKAREVFRIFEFHEIRTPIIEDTQVFVRSIGEDTDIVEKEMYTLEDRSGKSISLRPEGTASIIRSFIEQGLYKDNDTVKLFYSGPMFRSERPQKGRLRQFHQIGAEIIDVNGSSLYHDAELISNAGSVLDNIGIKGFTVYINSLGCKKDRDKYKKALTKVLSEKASELCDNCRRRCSTNVLRVLDCKNETCKKIVDKAPKIMDYLCRECEEHYRGVEKILKGLNVGYKEKPDLVRGLDYYTGIVFEIVHPLLGAQDAIAAGGRYDGLTKQMGGPDAGATGYAIGIERLMLIIDDEQKKQSAPGKGVLVVAVDEAFRDEAFCMLNKLRQRKIVCDMDNSGRSLKAIMRKANKENRRNVILIGEEEVKKKTFLLKDMETSEQTALSFKEVVDRLKTKGQGSGVKGQIESL